MEVDPLRKIFFFLTLLANQSRDRTIQIRIKLYSLNKNRPLAPFLQQLV